MTKLRVKRLLGEDERRNARLELWLINPRRYLTTILIGNNVVNVAASILASLLTENILLYFNVHQAAAFGSAIAFLVVTFFLLTFGEIIPKNYCKEHAVSISRKAILPLDVLYRLMRPFVSLFVGISNLVLWMTGSSAACDVPVLTEDEIRSLIEVSEKEGLLEQDEREMIHSVIDFGGRIVQEIMTPRVDVKALDIEEHGLSDVHELVVSSGHSRIPVFEHDLDQTLGILYAKDLLLPEGEDGKPLTIRKLLRPCMYVPEGKRVSDLLQAFRQEKTHIAIVVDEYGCTAGIVTIEDALEEIVGDIQDEYDTEPAPFLVEPDGAIVTGAKTDLDDLEKEFGIQLSLPEREFESVGGFVVSYLGEVPKVGDEFTFEDLSFAILAGDTRKVERVRIRRLNHDPQSDSGQESPPGETERNEKAS